MKRKDSINHKIEIAETVRDFSLQSFKQ